MLARVKWQSDRYDRNNKAIVEHGTILQFVHTGHNTVAVVARDGSSVQTRGQIILMDTTLLKVTTWFKWKEDTA